LITAELKKARYVYYHCTRTKSTCTALGIREEELARQLGEPLKRLRITPERMEWILEALKASHADERSRETRSFVRFEKRKR
jgi:hypothetical protein